MSKFHKHLFVSSRLLVVHGLVGESSIVVLGEWGDEALRTFHLRSPTGKISLSLGVQYSETDDDSLEQAQCSKHSITS